MAIDPNALASALPAGISYDVSDNHRWSAQGIAHFQAERLTESGYLLVCADDKTVDRVARILCYCTCLITNESGSLGPDYTAMAKEVLAALREVQ